MVWGFLETPMSSLIRISEHSVGLRCLLQTQRPLFVNSYISQRLSVICSFKFMVSSFTLLALSPL